MEEESLKRLTDCVYFLASPLTCKKGIECEYRHNEIARLNPRDCWYWLSGSCLNPSCAFRHPPLDVHTQLSSESTPSQDHCSSLVKKVEVPCYFFHNGFCKKGDKCSFLHGRDGSNDSLKVSHKAATIVDSPQLDKKSSTASNIVSVAMKTRPILSEAAPKLSDKSEIKLKEGNNKSDFKCQSASPNTSTSEFEEASKEGSIKSEAVMYTDHSSDEDVDIDIAEKDDWLESSPGFDVLVDDLSPNLGFEEDENYLVGIERDGGELNGHFLEYNHDDYAGNLHEERRIGSCVEFDDEIDEQESMILRNISRHESEKMNPYLNQRHLLPVKLPMDGLRNDDMRPYPRKDRAGDDIRHYPRKDRAGDDIRHYPRKDRVGDDIRSGDDIRPYSRNDRAGDDIRRNYSSPSMFFGHERSRQFGSERYSIGKFANNKGRFKVTKSTDQLRKPYDSRNRYLENKQSKRPVYLADRRPVTKRRINEEYSAFSGPKTLDQIKEEKRRGSGNGDSHGKFWSVSDSSEDFQAPKPLSEILKEKRKIHSVVNANNSIS